MNITKMKYKQHKLRAHASKKISYSLTNYLYFELSTKFMLFLLYVPVKIGAKNRSMIHQYFTQSNLYIILQEAYMVTSCI